MYPEATAPYDWTDAPAETAAAPRAGMLVIVQGWFTSPDTREAYLAQAVDHDDLAARTRQWDEQELRAAALFRNGIY